MAGLLVGAAGGILGALVEDLVALRARGYLPLTLTMWRVVRITRIAPGLFLAGGFLTAAAGVTVQLDGLIAAGFVVFVLAVPVGAVVGWRVEPHGALSRVNGVLMLKLTNVHADFVVAEVRRQRQALEEGSWPPGFIGPGPVPIRFREPLVQIVRRIADGDMSGLIEGENLSDPAAFEVQLEELGQGRFSLPPNTWETAQSGKYLRNPGLWWVAVPLWTAAAENQLWIDATVREQDGKLAIKVAIVE